MLKKLLLMSGALAVSACAGDVTDVKYEYPERVDKRYERPSEYKEQDRLFGADALTFKLGGDKNGKQTADAVKAPAVAEKAVVKDKAGRIWQAALPVMSRYPVEMMQDGFITTEWFNDADSPYRQLKINAVKTPDGAQITVLCRRRNGKGDWVNQKNDAALADKIKDDIVKLSLNH